MVSPHARSLLVIPAFNEQRSIGAVVDRVRATGLDLDVLVVNDGSRDDTATLARQHGAQVVSHPFNLGYGAALQTGYRYALRHGYARVVQMDADGQHDPDSLARILNALDLGHDLVLGSRFLDRESYRPPFARLVGMRLFRGIASLVLGRTITDATTGYRGLSIRLVDFYDRRGLFPHDCPDANIIVRTCRAGFRVTEVPVRMRDNPAGGSIHVGMRPVVYVFKMLFALGVETSRRLSLPEAG
jgi:glycosyltransferase involved in cell wall biosynthesis